VKTKQVMGRAIPLDTWELDFSHTDLSDVVPLAEFTQVRRLRLGHTQITQLHPLTDAFPHLRDVQISVVPLRDAWPMYQWTKLRRFVLSYCPVADMRVLGHMPHLEVVDIRHTNAGSLSMLEACRDVRVLHLGYTQIRDLSVLRELPKLEVLCLSGCEITDVSALRHLRRLRSLCLNNTPVRDLSVLEGLPSLTTLEVAHTPLADLEVLAQMSGLAWLDIRGVAASVEAQRWLRDNLSSRCLMQWEFGVARKQDRPQPDAPPARPAHLAPLDLDSR
jgi:Leucine-rich repeat (LRR) protein